MLEVLFTTNIQSVTFIRGWMLIIFFNYLCWLNDKDLWIFFIICFFQGRPSGCRHTSVPSNSASKWRAACRRKSASRWSSCIHLRSVATRRLIKTFWGCLSGLTSFPITVGIRLSNGPKFEYHLNGGHLSLDFRHFYVWLPCVPVFESLTVNWT